MEFKCSICDYRSGLKHHISRHVNKKNKCGEDPHIIEIKIEIRCEHCNKKYKSQTTLKRHYKVCKKVNGSKKDAEIAELKRQLEEERAKPRTVNNINNITVNVQINGYRDTSFEHLKDRHYQRAIRRMFNSVPQMIQDVHFNKNVPENHNIYISNIKNKYAMVYDGEKWCSKPQEKVIDDLINDQEYAIEEWLGEGERFPNEMKKFNEYLERKEAEDDIKETIKEEVKLLLYNNRGKIKTKC